MQKKKNNKNNNNKIQIMNCFCTRKEIFCELFFALIFAFADKLINDGILGETFFVQQFIA